MGQIDIIERLGGSSRCITILTGVIHFIHPLFCIINYCHWVHLQKDVLGADMVNGYLAMTIIACLFFCLVASVFYMWAWRFPDPEEVSKRRRIYGIVVNLIFSDIPMFVIEVTICWHVGFDDGVQGTSFIITCISFGYSSLRVWTFIIVKLIKVRAPVLARQAYFTGPVGYNQNGYPKESYTPEHSNGHYGSAVSPNFSRTGHGMDTSADSGGADYSARPHDNRGNFQNYGDFYNGNVTSDNDYRREVPYNDSHFLRQADQFSTPGTRDPRYHY